MTRDGFEAGARHCHRLQVLDVKGRSEGGPGEASDQAGGGHAVLLALTALSARLETGLRTGEDTHPCLCRQTFTRTVSRAGKQEAGSWLRQPPT